MSKKESSWRGVVYLPEANQLLKYIPEAVPTLNSYANMCKHNAQECYFLLRTIRKNKLLVIRDNLIFLLTKKLTYTA